MSHPIGYKKTAEQIFRHAVESVQPHTLIHRAVIISDNHLQIAGQSISLSEIGKIYVLGAGKATAAMAQALEEIIGNYIAAGCIIVKHGHTALLQYIQTIEAGHPIPDEHGIAGTKQLLQLVSNIKPEDLVIMLLSGGGSALLVDLPPGCSLLQLQQCFNLLLKSGATIKELNTVRKHLSQVKGGQLAKAIYPAKVITLILSDVVDDPLDVIASGPTVADPTTFADVWQVIIKYGLEHALPLPIQQYLVSGLQEKIAETPKPGDPVFESVINHIIGSNAIALKAASRKAIELGFYTTIISASITGEAREVAAQLVTHARTIALDANYPKPACLLMGGETTVTVTGKGLGGRNQELALAAALQLQPHENIVILSGGTDGSDGPNDAAGAVIDGNTVVEAAKLNLEAKLYLDANNSYPFFQQAGGHIITGPTLTNVMDIMMALVY